MPPPPRDPRTTPNFELPVPGDEHPPDYVSATGDLADAVDAALADISQIVYGEARQTGTVVLVYGQATEIPCPQGLGLRGGMTTNTRGLVIPVSGLYVITYQLGTMNGAGNSTLTGTARITAYTRNPAGTQMGFNRTTSGFTSIWPAFGGTTIWWLGEGGFLTIEVVHNTGSAGSTVYCDPTSGNQLGCSISALLIRKEEA